MLCYVINAAIFETCIPQNKSVRLDIHFYFRTTGCECGICNMDEWDGMLMVISWVGWSDDKWHVEILKILVSFKRCLSKIYFHLTISNTIPQFMWQG